MPVLPRYRVIDVQSFLIAMQGASNEGAHCSVTTFI